MEQRIDPLLRTPASPEPVEPFTIPPTGFRRDIEGLRAIAVVLVVVFHAELGSFAGGFIGVDVFFVVSGFLITSLLLGEIARTGTVSLPNFWARRARRLLPASCLVLVVTVVASQWLFDPLLLGNLARDAAGASGFVVNYVFAWREAHGDGGYFDADLAKSPLLHFWSLAVEEQFYVVWPLLLWGLARVARRLRDELTMVIAILWVASAVACLWLTDRERPWAFYSLPSRAWELLTGALVAVSIASLQRIRRPFVLPMALAGLVCIVAAALRFDAATTFPGVAAGLPVLGTALVIAAGSSLAAPAVLHAVLGCRPLLWIGQRSYAIYLWHWPALVLVAATWGPLSAWQRAAVVAGSVAVAALSYRLVENPIRHSSWVSARPRRSLLTGASLLTTSAVLAAILLVNPRQLEGGGEATALTLPQLEIPDATASSPSSSVTGPSSSLAPGETVPATTSTTVPVAPVTPALAELVALQQQLLEQGLTTREVPSNLRPSLAKVRGDLPGVYDNGCVLDPGETKMPICVYGNTRSSVTVAILGDSHAAHWYPALQKISLAHDWRLLYFAKKGCPPSRQPLRSALANRECNPWREQAIAKIVAERPSLIILTGYHYEAPEGSGKGGNTLWREGMTDTLTALGDLATHVVILGDTPTENADVPQCLSEHLRSVNACVSSRDYAVREQRLRVEADLAAQFGAHTVDTSDWLCTPRSCPVIIGDLLVYRDRNHLTPAAAEFLSPLLEAALVPLVV